jgi:hypothetical protein
MKPLAAHNNTGMAMINDKVRCQVYIFLRSIIVD